MVLDLSVFQEETLDVKLADGRMLHLKKPDQGMVIAMLRLSRLDESTPPEEVLAVLNHIVLRILNHNADGIEFTKESVSALTLDMKIAILNAYSDWTVKLQENPICSSPQSPAKTAAKARRSLCAVFTPWRNTRD